MPANYSILGGIATGGMATVYLGRMTASAGFSRLVAIKRLHAELANDKDFVAMLVDEARLAGQIRHPNVIDTLDLYASDGAFSLVLEYVEGASISALWKCARRLGEQIPIAVSLTIIHGVLRGLHAAHEARGEDESPLGIVHRDVSPQNVLVGTDGIPRVIDFGIAKASGRIVSTRPGEVRGKFAYMSPEQLLSRPVTRQADIYATGVMLWELLAGERLFTADDERAICAAVIRGDIKAPSTVNNEVTSALDEIVLRATARDVADRYLTAGEMLADLEALTDVTRAPDNQVGNLVRHLASDVLAKRQKLLARTPSPPVEIADVMNDLARSAGLSSGPISSPESYPSVDPMFASGSNPAFASHPSLPPLSPLSATGIAVVGSPAQLPLSSDPALRNRIFIGAIVGIVLGLGGATIIGVRARSNAAAAAAAQQQLEQPAPTAAAVMSPPDPTVAPATADSLAPVATLPTPPPDPPPSAATSPSPPSSSKKKLAPKHPPPAPYDPKKTRQ